MKGIAETCTRTNLKGQRVWFPEDENGEPNVLNPDDGCGGGLFKLETIHAIYYSSTGDDDILEGRSAREFAKAVILGKDWQRTTDLVYREYSLPVEQGGCGGDWALLEDKLHELEEPYWAVIGELRGRVQNSNGDSPEDDDCDGAPQACSSLTVARPIGLGLRSTKAHWPGSPTLSSTNLRNTAQ